MRISLHPGVWTTGFGLASTGTGGVTMTSAWSIPWMFGWASIIVGIGVFVWGIKLDGQHWWRRLLLRRQQAHPSHQQLREECLTRCWNPDDPDMIEEARQMLEFTAHFDEFSRDRPDGKA